jgi:23S rRNA pseudouridine2604 synthase
MSWMTVHTSTAKWIDTFDSTASETTENPLNPEAKNGKNIASNNNILLLTMMFSLVPRNARFPGRLLISASSNYTMCRLFSNIRLSKRMGELDLCSRREGDRWIREGKVFVDGQVAVLGQKVEEDLQKDQISIVDQDVDSGQPTTCSAVVLHKPPGYVAGQAEHEHTPAIRLLTRDRLWDTSDIVLPTSWKGFAPAGRLDLDSTGLLVFTASGVVAKKLIHHDSKVEKEYIVDVEPAVTPTRREHELDEHFALPLPTLDLSLLQQGGQTLLGDSRPLKPCQAAWMEKGKQLRLILNEGKKHHIRRVCREFLGYHVVSLQRIRIGPINLYDLPEGCWRPLKPNELDELLG